MKFTRLRSSGTLTDWENSDKHMDHITPITQQTDYE